MSDQTQVISISTTSTSNYKELFSNITHLDEGDVVTVKSCKLCNHIKRADAEMKWEETRNENGEGSTVAVTNLLNEYAKETPGADTFTVANVRNHMHSHYKMQQRKIALRTYGERLSEMFNHRMTQFQTMDILAQSLYMKFLEIASDQEMNSAKQADSMTKLSKSIQEIAAAQALLNNDISMVEMYKQKFVNTFVQVVNSEQNPERRKYLLMQLSALESVDAPLEKKD